MRRIIRLFLAGVCASPSLALTAAPKALEQVHPQQRPRSTRVQEIANSSSGRSVVLMRDQNLVIGGQWTPGTDDVALVVKLSPSGRLVEWNSIRTSSRDSISNLMVQGDKIVAGGHWGNVRPLLMRLDGGLRLDPSFAGGDGIVQDDCTYGDWGTSFATSQGILTLRTTGSSAIRREVRRYTPNGDLSVSYGYGGISTMNPTDLEFWPSATAGADGSLYIYGNASGGEKIVKLNPDGMPDPTFGTGGAVSWSNCSSISGAEITLLTEGRIYAYSSSCESYRIYDATGNLLENGNANFMGLDNSVSFHTTESRLYVMDYEGKVLALSRSNLQPVTSFGQGGVAAIAHPLGAVTTYDLVERPDGSVIVAGEVGDRLVAVGLTPAGQLDDTFGTRGFFLFQP